MRRLTSTMAVAFLTLILFPPAVLAETYPIIAYGTRTFVAEATETGGTILVRVYRRTGRASWHRYGGFTLPAGQLAARRAAVRRDPESASAPERVYFTGKIIGATPFKPSSPLYHDRWPRVRFKVRRK